MASLYADSAAKAKSLVASKITDHTGLQVILSAVDAENILVSVGNGMASISTESDMLEGTEEDLNQRWIILHSDIVNRFGCL